jgi:hypothetical protein
MHPCPEKVGAPSFLQTFMESQDRFLHSFFKPHWRLERFVWSDFENVCLKFFSERESGQLNRVDDSAAEVFYDFIDDRQGFQLIVHDGEFMFGSKNFQRFVRNSSSLATAALQKLNINVQLILNTPALIP